MPDELKPPIDLELHRLRREDAAGELLLLEAAFGPLLDAVLSAGNREAMLHCLDDALLHQARQKQADIFRSLPRQLRKEVRRELEEAVMRRIMAAWGEGTEKKSPPE